MKQCKKCCDSCHEQLLRYWEALLSISSPNKPRHADKEYWLGIGLDTTAEVLARDTTVARQALDPTYGGENG